MPISLTLPVRTWAALDAALGFFRAVPTTIAAAQDLCRHCRRLHTTLRRSGLKAWYIPVGLEAPGRSLLRLHIRGRQPPHESLMIELPRRVARGAARACLTILDVQADLGNDGLLDHEAEELQAVRAFLTEIRRGSEEEFRLFIPRQHGLDQLTWDETRHEYSFTGPVALKVCQHYLRVGACLN
jgi:hypothetical protein